jgi:hypothetical protein
LIKQSFGCTEINCLSLIPYSKSAPFRSDQWSFKEWG